VIGMLFAGVDLAIREAETAQSAQMVEEG